MRRSPLTTEHAGDTDPEVIAKNLALGEHIKKGGCRQKQLTSRGSRYAQLEKVPPSQANVSLSVNVNPILICYYCISRFMRMRISSLHDRTVITIHTGQTFKLARKDGVRWRFVFLHFFHELFNSFRILFVAVGRFCKDGQDRLDHRVLLSVILQVFSGVVGRRGGQERFVLSSDCASTNSRSL